MTLEPVFAAMMGGWNVTLLLGVIGVLGLVAVMSLAVVAVVLLKRERTRQVASRRAPSGPEH